MAKNRIVYYSGQVLCETTGTTFVKEVQSKNGQRRAIVKCGKCGLEYEAGINNIKKGQLCYQCGHNKQVSHQRHSYYKGQTLNSFGVQFIEDADIHARPRTAYFLCKCGNTFCSTIKSVKDGTTCPECSRKKQSLAKIKYKDGDILNDCGTQLIQRLDSSNGIVKCGMCGKKYTGNISSIACLNSCCPDCASTRVAASKIIYNVGDTILSNNGLLYYFESELETVTLSGKKHRRGVFYIVDKDGNKISPKLEGRLDGIVQGNITGKNISKDVILAKEWLNEHQLAFDTEVTFPDLIAPDTKRNLKLDIVISGLSPNVVLEIDGKQHYNPVKYWGGEEWLKRTQFLDSIKDEYFKNHSEYVFYRIRSKEVKDIKAYLDAILLDRM